MSQNTTYQRSHSELSPGQLFLQRLNGVIGVVFIVSTFVYMQPKWGEWTRLAFVPLVVAATLAVTITAVRLMLRTRAKRNQRLVEALHPLMGPGWDSKKDLKTGKFSQGLPRKIVLTYPGDRPDHDPEWRRRIEEIARHRMELKNITATWDTRKGKAVFQEKTEETPAEKQQQVFDKSEQRVHDILRPMFGTDIHVTVHEWQQPKEDTK